MAARVALEISARGGEQWAVLDGSTLDALATALNDGPTRRRSRDELATSARRGRARRRADRELSMLAAGAVDVTAFFGVVRDQLHSGTWHPFAAAFGRRAR